MKRSRVADYQALHGGASVGDRWLVLCCFLFALAALLPVLTAAPQAGELDPIATRTGDSPSGELARAITKLYYDDGFYYLTIARNWSEGLGSTFDGRNRTNGYQPLWLMLLLPLAVVFSTPEGLLVASMALQALAAALVAAILYRASRYLAGPLASVIAVLLWVRFQHSYYTAWSGMEYSVHALVVACLLFVSLRLSGRRSLSDRQVVFLGLLGSLAFLARIENLLLAFLVGLGLRRRISSRYQLALYAAPVVLTTVTYLLVNQLLFGHPLPVSGAIKVAWSADLLARDPIYQAQGWVAAKAADSVESLVHFSRSGVIGLVVGSLGASIIALRSSSLRLRALLPVAVFGLLQFFLYSALFHGGQSIKPWYFAGQFLVASLIGAFLLRSLSGLGPRRLVVPAIVLMGILIVCSTGLNAVRHRAQIRDESDPFVSAAGWLQQEAPADARVAAWNAGMIAFLSNRQVTNLDGLVNSWSFYRHGRHDLCAYFERERIDYVVDVVNLDRPFELHQKELASCVGRWELVWEGTRYARPGPPWGAAAFRWRGQP